jgi:hypothetical protein
MRRPRKERGVISPYPTVVIVTRTNQALAGMEANWLGSPSELTKVPMVASQVPRSAKYLGGCGETVDFGSKSMNRAHRRVEKMVSIMITKKPIAKRACWERRTDKYMTSIVLF